jgi:hypothetical protein
MSIPTSYSGWSTRRRRFIDRVSRAVARQLRHYPTVARQAALLGELKQVAVYDPILNHLIMSDVA